MKWPLVKLEDVALQAKGAIVSGPFGSNIGSRFFVEEGVPVIRGNNLTFGQRRFIDDGFAYLTEAKAQEFRNCDAVADDLIFTAAGTIGQVGIIPAESRFERYIISNKQLRVRCDQKKTCPLFLFLWFTTEEMRHQIVGRNTGGAVPLINLSILRKLPVPLPPREVQQRIADTIAAYDNLIENNRRRMALLEQAARELYREWFVRLRFPGHEHTRITNGVPEGWVRKSLGELADYRLGKMLDQDKNKGDLMPYLANVNVRWGEIALNNLREMRFEDSELDSFGLRQGDIVMCEGGEPGRCALWKEQLPRMLVQKAIHRIRTYPEVSYLFLYYSLRHKGQSGQMAKLFTGATIKHLPREKLALVTIDVPPAPLMTLFAEQVVSLEKQIGLLETANRRASQTRDLLLPRLMSGAIAV